MSGSRRRDGGRRLGAGEAAGLAGLAKSEAAAAALVARGAGAVVVTFDAAGAHLLGGGGPHHRLPAPAVNAVDTAGDGDVLAGVLAAGLDAGGDQLGAAA
jgi:ribokinase